MADSRVRLAVKITDPATDANEAGVDATGNLKVNLAANSGVDIGDVDVLSLPTSPDTIADDAAFAAALAYLAASDVVAVIMAVDHVFHWLIETPTQFRLQPGRRILVDRIDENYPVGRHQEHGIMEIVFKLVDIARDIRDRPLRREDGAPLVSLHRWKAEDDEAHDASALGDLARSAALLRAAG